jgi:hypothetical protein
MEVVISAILGIPGQAASGKKIGKFLFLFDGGMVF